MKTLIISSFALATAALLSSGAQAASFAPLPPQIGAGMPILVKLDGFAPRQTVEIKARRKMRGSAYSAHATYRADAKGRIDLAKQNPTAGDYEGADPAGLFWSMNTDASAAEGLGDDEVRLDAVVDGRPVATVSTKIVEVAPDVTVEPLAGFPGAKIFKPAKARGRLPTIIILGGAEGGTATSMIQGPWFAKAGYLAVGLPYWSPTWAGPEIPELPGAFVNIPVERLETVREALLERKDVRADRIGLWGVSKGGEFAVLAASRFSWLKAVVAVVPSDVVWEGFGAWGAAADTTSSFAERGKPLAWMPYEGMPAAMSRAGRGQPPGFRQVHDRGRAAHPDRLAAARIPIENYAGPLMVVGGDRDDLWDSYGMSQNIVASRKLKGLPTEALLFDNAGHLLALDEWRPATTSNPSETVTDLAKARRRTGVMTKLFFAEHLK